MKKFNKKKVVKPRLTVKQSILLENLPHNRFMHDQKEAKKNKRLSCAKKTLIVFLVAVLARNFINVDRPNIYVNNQKKIEENLKILNIEDELLLKSNINREYLVNFNKNITVGVHEDLGEEQISALNEAVEYMNYIIHGLNPEYKISLQKINDFTYKTCDVVVSEYDFIIKLKGAGVKLFDLNFDIDNGLMATTNTNGLINTNAIYKSHIYVNEHHFEDGKYSYDEMVTCYIHELCHCVLGFSDVKTSKDTIMDSRGRLNDKSLYYHDLMSAAAVLCDMEDDETKTRVYNFITSELIKQVERGVSDKLYREFASKKATELIAEVSMSITN